MKSAKGYSLVITFTVAIETRDIRLQRADSSVFCPKNGSSACHHLQTQLWGELFSPQAPRRSPRTWAAVILYWKPMIKDRYEDALPVASALKCASCMCAGKRDASWGQSSVVATLFIVAIAASFCAQNLTTKSPPTAISLPDLSFLPKAKLKNTLALKDEVSI